MTTSPARGSAIERLLQRLASPRARLWIVIVAIMLVAPAVTVGFAADDHVLRARIGDVSAFPGFAASRWDLFVFMSGDPAQRERLLDGGTFAWWVAPHYKLAFWRPVSAATHVLDFALWPTSPAAMMIHSIAWLVIVLTLVHALARRFHGASVAGLVLLLYALDDARGPAVGYISNRNALVMASFGFAVLLAHDRWRREGWRWGALLGPSSFAVGMLAGEGTVATAGYLFAHACFVDRGRWRERVRALVPYAVVLIAWALAYKALGYGSHGSGIYIEPADDPVAFVATAIERIPVLLLGQLFGPWSDFWLGYPADVARVVYGLAWLVLAGFAWWVAPIVRADPVARMWATGGVLACVPIAGTFPADRLLAFVGLGAMGLVAMALHGTLAGGAPARRGRLAHGVALAMVLVHLVAAPLLLPVRSRSMVTVEESLAMFDRAVPEDPAITTRTVVVVLAPNEGLVSYFPVMRAVVRRPAPAHLRLLASATSPTRVARTGARTLVLEPAGGLLSTTAERMLRSPRIPFAAGDRVAVSGMTVTVETITNDGRPQRVRFDFTVDLDDPSLLWLRWDVLGFVPWTPPAIGDSDTLPGFDVAAALTAALERRDAT
ncbi:MAG TPA: hypothetical protein VFG69_16110 [Nannocystaceae bacterium]|nr:hypothetical protein [Nannocystaceae bacterium]